MSQHAEDEPTVRVRRKTVLPARYDEYDLTGFTLPKPVSQPMSPLTYSTRLAEDDEAEEGAIGFTPLLPGYEAESQLQWSDEDYESASYIIRRENQDLRRALQILQQERDTFQSSTDQYSKELSQLKQHMEQLQIQLKYQGPGIQPLSSVDSPKQYSSSRPIPAPRVQLQAHSEEKSFRPDS